MNLQLDNKITTGNIITIVVTVVSFIITATIAWVQLNNAITAVSDRTAALEALISARTAARDAQAASYEARIRAVEIAQASQSSDLRAIQIGVSRIEAKLDRMESKP